jgi:hypothetical protein
MNKFFGIHFYIHFCDSDIIKPEDKTRDLKGGITMNDVGKGMLIILVILYIISPIDFAPGPVDDAIVLLLGLAAAKKRDNAG